MRKHTWVFISCCVITGLIFLSFAALPSFANTLSVENIRPLNIWVGLFYSILLSHPYIRTAQLIANRSMASQEQTFSDFQQRGMALEYWISRVGKLLIVTVAIWMALTSLVETMSTLHYLIMPLYMLSIILLDLVTEKVILGKQDELTV